MRVSLPLVALSAFLALTGMTTCTARPFDEPVEGNPPRSTSNPPTLSGAGLSGFVQTAGTARDVVVKPDSLSRHLAYVSSDEFGLGIFDVTDPSQPIAMGAVRPSFKGGLKVAVDGSLAVVGSGSNGMYVVDVSDPTQPQAIGWLAGEIRGVAISGQVAYARIGVSGNPAHTDLAVVDLSTPESPTIVGQIFLSSSDEVELSGNRLFVTAGGALQVFDITDPLSPQPRGLRAIPNGARELAVGGNYAYVGNLSSIHAVNVTNPSNPVVTDSIDIGAFDLALADSRLYSVGGGLRTIDVSNPTALSVLGTADDLYAQGVSVVGNVAAVASPQINVVDGAGGLYLFDMSVPTNPAEVGHVLGAFGGNFGVAASGSIAVVASGSAGMHVVDISDPNQPEPIGWLDANVRGVAMSGRYAYARVNVPGNPAHVDLAVVDLETPGRPTVIQQIFLAGSDAIAVEGSRLYASTGSALEVFDISTPSSALSLGSVSIPGGALVLAVAHDFAYVGNYNSTHVVDVRNPANASVVGSIGGLTFGLAAQGTTLYSVGGGLRVIDVSNPARPVLRSTADDFGAMGVDVMGNLAFVVSPSREDADLYVYDVADPDAPELLDRIAIPGPGRRVCATTDYAYVGDDTSLIDVISLQ